MITDETKARRIIIQVAATASRAQRPDLAVALLREIADEIEKRYMDELITGQNGRMPFLVRTIDISLEAGSASIYTENPLAWLNGDKG